MDFSFYVVMTLLCVNVYGDLLRENSTVAGVDQTTTVLQESASEAFGRSTATFVDGVQNGIVTGHSPTIDANYIANITEKATQNIVDKETSTVTSTDATTVHSETENSVGVTMPETTISPETLNELANNSDTSKQSLPTSTLSPAKKIIGQTIEQTTMTGGEGRTDSSKTALHVEKTTTMPPPEDFFKWLDNMHPDAPRGTNETETGKGNNESHAYGTTTDNKNVNKVFEDVESSFSNEFDADKMPPREFMAWLDSINGNATKIGTVTATNIIDTSIISTEKLIIVISTICGTFVLFVVILIAISCCKRNRNIRNDSEKSDFSVTSVISIPDKRKSDTFSTDKNGFNNLFMGIPANNEVWRNLEQLSPADSSVMPESTKM